MLDKDVKKAKKTLIEFKNFIIENNEQIEELLKYNTRITEKIAECCEDIAEENCHGNKRYNLLILKHEVLMNIARDMANVFRGFDYRANSLFSEKECKQINDRIVKYL